MFTGELRLDDDAALRQLVVRLSDASAGPAVELERRAGLGEGLLHDATRA